MSKESSSVSVLERPRNTAAEQTVSRVAVANTVSLTPADLESAARQQKSSAKGKFNSGIEANTTSLTPDQCSPEMLKALVAAAGLAPNAVSLEGFQSITGGYDTTVPFATQRAIALQAAAGHANPADTFMSMLPGITDPNSALFGSQLGGDTLGLYSDEVVPRETLAALAGFQVSTYPPMLESIVAGDSDSFCSGSKMDGLGLYPDTVTPFSGDDVLAAVVGLPELNTQVLHGTPTGAENTQRPFSSFAEAA